MKTYHDPHKFITIGVFLPILCSASVQAQATVIDLSVSEISQPYTNTTSVST